MHSCAYDLCVREARTTERGVHGSYAVTQYVVSYEGVA